MCVFKIHFETAFRERVQSINSLLTTKKRGYGHRQTKLYIGKTGPEKRKTIIRTAEGVSIKHIVFD